MKYFYSEVDEITLTFMKEESKNLPQICKFLRYLIFFLSRETGDPIHVHVCKGKPSKDATKI